MTILGFIQNIVPIHLRLYSVLSCDHTMKLRTTHHDYHYPEYRSRARPNTQSTGNPISNHQPHVNRAHLVPPKPKTAVRHLAPHWTCKLLARHSPLIHHSPVSSCCRPNRPLDAEHDGLPVQLQLVENGLRLLRPVRRLQLRLRHAEQVHPVRPRELLRQQWVYHLRGPTARSRVSRLSCSMCY